MDQVKWALVHLLYLDISDCLMKPIMYSSP